MHITNPRSQQYPQLQSHITSYHREPISPKMTQIHSDRVAIVTSSDQIIGEADGMVTNHKNLELQTRVADCGNIYAYDPIAQVIGVCHSGRQGSHKNIIHNMILSMISLSSDPTDIRIRTGPCISGRNYQFGQEVTDLLDEKYYTPDTSLPGMKQSGEHYYLNLPLLYHDQLIGSGILSAHIIQSEICTFETLYLPSYRRDGADSGRITGNIMMIT